MQVGWNSSGVEVGCAVDLGADGHGAQEEDGGLIGPVQHLLPGQWLPNWLLCLLHQRSSRTIFQNAVLIVITSLHKIPAPVE